MKSEQLTGLVKSVAPFIIKQLKLDHNKISWVVLHSKDKEVVKRFPKSDVFGFTEYDDKKMPKDTYIIYLAYNNLRNKKSAVSTILHELLHVKLSKLDKEFKSYKRAEPIIEQIILDLEKFIMDL